MNIEHKGKTYEVLTLDRISEITHAKLAGGAVTTAKASLCGAGITVSSIGTDLTTTLIDREIEDFGIQPLRLVPKEPVTFDAIFYKNGPGGWHPLHDLDDGLAYQGYEQRKFRCVEMMEANS
jgi:hypothetical protein